MKSKFPKAKVEFNLETENADVFFIIGEVRRALKEVGASAADANKFNAEAMGKDYNHLLDTVDKWVDATWIGNDPRKSAPG